MTRRRPGREELVDQFAIVGSALAALAIGGVLTLALWPTAPDWFALVVIAVTLPSGLFMGARIRIAQI